MGKPNRNIAHISSSINWVGYVGIRRRIILKYNELGNFDVGNS